MKDVNITIRINQDTKNKLEELKTLIENDINFPITVSSVVRFALDQYLNKELYNYNNKKIIQGSEKN